MKHEETCAKLLGGFQVADLPVRTQATGGTWNSKVPIVRLSIGEQPIEHFLVDIGDEKNRVDVLSIDRNFRQVVLLVKEPKREYEVTSQAVRTGEQKVIKKHTDPTERRYLMGMDESHLFISGLPQADNVSTVAEAHQALKHKAVVQAEKEGREIKRQGEYFFVPLTEKEEDELREKCARDVNIKCKKDKLRRGGHRPHWVRRLIRMRRNRKIYAHGVVTHEQHEPLRLPGWHSVYRNRETESIGISGYID